MMVPIKVLVKGKANSTAPPVTREVLEKYSSIFEHLPPGDARNAAFHLLGYVRKAEREKQS